MSYSNFGMSYYLVVHGVACLYAVDDLAFLVITHTWNHGYGLVEIDIEVGILGIDFLNVS